MQTTITTPTITTTYDDDELTARLARVDSLSAACETLLYEAKQRMRYDEIESDDELRRVRLIVDTAAAALGAAKGAEAWADALTDSDADDDETFFAAWCRAERQYLSTALHRLARGGKNRAGKALARAYASGDYRALAALFDA